MKTLHVLSHQPSKSPDVLDTACCMVSRNCRYYVPTPMLKKQNQCVLWTVTSSIHSYQRVPSMYAVTNIQEAATDTVQAT